MADFPATTPTFTDFNGSATLAANNHAARHNKVHAEIGALAAKVGIDGSADTDSHDYKIATLESSVSTNTSDIADLDSTKASTSDLTSAIAAAKQALYPVGSIYFNATDDTNPGTLLGFGTWVAFGAGRVPVGFNSGDTDFDTAEETGGAKTHTLTIDEMPAHTHTEIVSRDVSPGSGLKTPWSDGTPASARATASTGGGGAHNNLQPYIVVYMWKRTA